MRCSSPTCSPAPDRSAGGRVSRLTSAPRSLALAVLLALGTSLAPACAQRAADPEFAALVARLSEPGGYFDSDNIVTNEASYLFVSSQLAKVGVHGGVYIGVGPDQNFSYVALIKPSIAFMLDIRRDNMLEHLLFKSLFELSRNRFEYLCLLLGKPVPSDIDSWTGKPTAQILAWLGRTTVDSAAVRASRKASNDRISTFGVSLDVRDRAMIDRYRAEFISSGLDTRYSSLGRNNRMDYPSFGELIVATDRAGKQIGYLADEDAFQYVRSMQQRDRILPVVANVAGDQAMKAIARFAAERKLEVSAFYLSNVEQYLIQRNQGFERYAANVKALPHGPSSVIIRSYFGRGRMHPLYDPSNGGTSTSLVETFDSFIRRYDAGEIPGYQELVFKGYITP